MGKTPYELRYELLMMAQSIISENIQGERTRLENDWHIKRDAALNLIDKGHKVDIPSFPTMPEISVNDIISLAEKLNTFVSKDS